MTAFVLLLQLIAALLYTTPEVEAKWMISGSSRMEITGATNVNTFQCLSVNYDGKDVMLERSHRGGNRSLHGEIIMKATSFECNNAVMTKDFAKTVKASDFPEIIIRFVNLSEEAFSSEARVLTGKVEITLAGNSSRYPVTCTIRSISENVNHLEGRRQFKFSDFGLEPPQKLFGAVQVKDEVWVDFHLQLVRL